MNRRDRIRQYYSEPRSQRGALLEKAAASSDHYNFRGNKSAHTVVVRTDLNGYSVWARDLEVASRAELLDEFFSSVVPDIEKGGGVFYRDEGDCIVAVFSDYFSNGATYDSVESYCLKVSSRKFGTPQLTAKTSVACGSVLYFQKAHEEGTQDWSAEGDAFVRAARLEHAIESKRQVVFFANEYTAHFANTSNVAKPGTSAAWSVNRKKRQVPGIGEPGGWSELVALEYRR